MQYILVLNYEFPPLGGGQATANYFCFQEWKKEKETYFFLVTSSSNTKRVEKFSDNIEIYYVDVGKKNKNLHHQTVFNLLTYFWKAFFLSRSIIKKYPIKKILCWSYPPIILGYLFYKWYNVPYISLLRGSEVPFYEKKWRVLDTCFFQFTAPIFWKYSKYVIANSEGLKQLALKTSPKENIYVVTNGVNTKDFYPKKDIAIRGQNFSILYVGRLTERKQVHVLIDAFFLLYQKYDNIELHIVGEGEDMHQLKKHVHHYALGHCIFFHGNILRSNLLPLYHQADIFVLPSSNEGMSNSLLEAMACGLPIIISKHMGGKEELFHENGWIVETTKEDLHEKLLLAYKEWNEGVLYTKGKKSREIIMSMTWEQKAKELFAFL